MNRLIVLLGLTSLPVTAAEPLLSDLGKGSEIEIGPHARGSRMYLQDGVAIGESELDRSRMYCTFDPSPSVLQPGKVLALFRATSNFTVESSQVPGPLRTLSTALWFGDLDHQYATLVCEKPYEPGADITLAETLRAAGSFLQIHPELEAKPKPATGPTFLGREGTELTLEIDSPLKRNVPLTLQRGRLVKNPEGIPTCLVYSEATTTLRKGSRYELRATWVGITRYAETTGGGFVGQTLVLDLVNEDEPDLEALHLVCISSIPRVMTIEEFAEIAGDLIKPQLLLRSRSVSPP